MADLEKVRELRDVQGREGNWNYDAYMQGLYNGMELAVAILEDREPIYRSAPAEWLHDKPRQSVIGEEAAAGPGTPIPPGECLAPNCNCEPGACIQRVEAVFHAARAPAGTATDALRQAAEQFVASCKDGNVADLVDYYEEIFKEALGVAPTDELGYATRLAEAIWRKRFQQEAPQWKPLPDLMGVLTQIDNMVAGLMKLAAAVTAVPADCKQCGRQLRLDGRCVECDVPGLAPCYGLPGSYVNAAGISAADMPHTVVQKLDAAARAAAGVGASDGGQRG